MIYIKTFGEFDIIIEDKSLLSAKTYQYRLVKLFMYLLTFKGRRLIPEKIIDDVIEDHGVTEPINILRTQISRLRKGFAKIPCFYTIDFSYGYYEFDLNNDVLVDTDIFEKSIRKGDELLGLDNKKAMDHYKEAIDIYNGEYLGGIGFDTWINPVRYKYERLYMQALIKLMDLYKELGQHNKVLQICEKAFDVLDNNDTISLYYTEALVNSGDINMARYYYQKVVMQQMENYDHNIRLKMNKVYNKLFTDSDMLTTDFEDIDRKLVNDEKVDQVKFVSLDQFKCLYTMVKSRTKEGKSIPNFLGLITMEALKSTIDSEKNYIINMNILENILKGLLEKGDTFAYGTDKQFYLIVYNRKVDQLEALKEGIIEKFHTLSPKKFMDIDVRFNQITAN